MNGRLMANSVSIKISRHTSCGIGDSVGVFMPGVWCGACVGGVYMGIFRVIIQVATPRPLGVAPGRPGGGPPRREGRSPPRRRA